MVSATRRLWVGLLAFVAIAACTQATGDSDPPSGLETETDFVGSIALEPDQGLPGTEVTVTGVGLPPSSELTLQWNTVAGRWVIEGERGEEYKGRAFDPVAVDLSTVQTDQEGAFSATFEVPEDFGFAHDVRLVDAAGIIRNQAMFDVDMDVSVTPTEGPPGTPITIVVRGMGWQTLENTRAIVYDNVYTGWMSAVTTRGYARAVIPATGSPGPHQIGILRGAYTFPYLNPEQSPRPDILVYEATFTVTDGPAVLPPPIEEQNPGVRAAVVPDSTGSDSWVAVDVAAGPVGTPMTIVGGGAGPSQQVVIEWFRIVGNRVGGQGWDEQSLSLGTAVSSADGTFELPTVVPGDVGGGHRIEAVVDGETVATTEFVVTPAAASITPERGRWGTDITINLTGVGWTETANIYTVVYDNGYIGYACGFNSQGDVEVTLKATGEPGWHFIDLYPAIYKGDESPGQENFRIPQLTYQDDHPGESLPAFHFAFFLEGQEGGY
jgi:hypothetical protein